MVEAHPVRRSIRGHPVVPLLFDLRAVFLGSVGLHDDLLLADGQLCPFIYNEVALLAFIAGRGDGIAAHVLAVFAQAVKHYDL